MLGQKQQLFGSGKSTHFHALQLFSSFTIDVANSHAPALSSGFPKALFRSCSLLYMYVSRVEYTAVKSAVKWE